VQDTCGGICIAAHVTSDKGILKALEGGARSDCWKTPELLAAHIPTDVALFPHEGTKRILANEDENYRRERKLAYVQTSDARSPEDIGTQSVWIKMQRPTVEGLRKAFLDPESRISSEDPYAARAAGEILSIGWEGGFLDGQSVGLSPQLSCLIGSKGTGKSTVIESLRWAFDLDAPGGGDTESLLAHAIRPGSKVTVRLRTSAPAAEHTIERTMPHAPVVRDAIGSVVADLAPLSLRQLRVFSQKQLYDTAQSVEGRLELIDEFARDELAAVRAEERRQIAALHAGARAMQQELARIEQWEEQLSELPALEQWRKRFADAGFEERLRERRALDREEARWAALDAALLQRLRAVERLRDETPPPTTAQASDDWPNVDLLRSAEALVAASTTSFADALAVMRTDLLDARTRLADARGTWTARRAARQADFDAALRELQSSMPDVDRERYLDVERRIEALLPLQEELQRARGRVALGRRGGIRRSKSLRICEPRNTASGRPPRSTSRRPPTAMFVCGPIIKAIVPSCSSRCGDARLVCAAARSKRWSATPTSRPRSWRDASAIGVSPGRSRCPTGRRRRWSVSSPEADLLTLEVAELCDEATVELDIGTPEIAAINR
jgi:hypothetical protein